MPCYRLFCLAKPGLGRDQQAAVIRTAATSILDGGGVLMDLRSFGEKALAYVVRPAGQAFDEVSEWRHALQSVCSVMWPSHILKGLTVCRPICGSSCSTAALRSCSLSTTG